MEKNEMYLSPSCYKSETVVMGMKMQSEVINKRSGGTENMQMGKRTYSKEERKGQLAKYRLDKDLYYSDNGDRLELVGIESVMGEDCYLINRVNANASSSEYYSISSGLLLQTDETPKSSDLSNEPVTNTTQYTNYKDFNGLMTPTNLSVNFSMGMMQMELKSFEINVNIKSKDFIWKQ